MDVPERWARRENLALLTDFYQLTMMGGYWKTGREDLTACFNYVFRDLPPHNGFAVAAGLEQLLDLVEGLRFTSEDVLYLSGLGIFDPEFLEYLREFRITCTIQAVPEGTVVFPHEPILQVEGPLVQAQLLETAILNTMNFQTLIATKAARIRQACGDDNLVEFGLRRAQGPDGGLSGSRAAYIGGADSTSNVLAGRVFGIPVRGTHAHSWVMSFDDELSAFRAYADCFPDPILLVDTYDTLTSGLPNAVTVFKELRAAGRPARAAVRLDSGDLARLSKAAYQMFTEAGFEDPLIVASNELTEDLIADLKRQGAPINSWGVGTHLITSSDYPALGGVYKLVAIRTEEGEWKPRIKLSSNAAKMTDPGRKRVLRYLDEQGRFLADVIGLVEEDSGDTWGCGAGSEWGGEADSEWGGAGNQRGGAGGASGSEWGGAGNQRGGAGGASGSEWGGASGSEWGGASGAAEAPHGVGVGAGAGEAGRPPVTPAPILFADRQDAHYLRGVTGVAACESLLQTVVRDGVRVGPRSSLEEIRARARRQTASLPEETRRLRYPEIYTVGLSPELAKQKVSLAAQAPGVLGPAPSDSAPSGAAPTRPTGDDPEPQG